MGRHGYRCGCGRPRWEGGINHIIRGETSLEEHMPTHTHGRSDSGGSPGAGDGQLGVCSRGCPGGDDQPLPGAGSGTGTRSANIYWENPKKPCRWGWKCSFAARVSRDGGNSPVHGLCSRCWSRGSGTVPLHAAPRKPFSQLLAEDGEQGNIAAPRSLTFTKPTH